MSPADMKAVCLQVICAPTMRQLNDWYANDLRALKEQYDTVVAHIATLCGTRAHFNRATTYNQDAMKVMAMINEHYGEPDDTPAHD